MEDVIKLWLDDLRPAPNNDWIWAKTAEECIEVLTALMKEGKVVNVAQLDHDLGGMAYNFCEVCRSEQDFAKWQEIVTYGCEHFKTGATVVEWMVANQYWPKEIVIHSYNFDGARKMANLAKDWTHVTIRPFSTKDFT